MQLESNNRMELPTEPAKSVAICGDEFPDAVRRLTGKSDPATDARTQKRLFYLINELYAQGYDTFFCGMAEGFDLMAAESVMSLIRYRGLSLRLIVVTTPTERDKPYSGINGQIFVHVLDTACAHIGLHGNTPSAVNRDKTEMLLDNCSVVVTYFDGSVEVSRSIVSRATSLGKTIYNLCTTPDGRPFVRHADERIMNELIAIK